MDNKYLYIIFGVLSVLLVILGGLFLFKYLERSSISDESQVATNGSSTDNVLINNISTNNVVAKSSGKLVPKNISDSVEIANNSKKVPIANNSNVAIIGTNNTITVGQDVINTEDMKRWCINGSSMSYNKVPNSNEWVVSSIVIYQGAGYCFAKKTSSITNYLFNEGYKTVYSVTGTGRDAVYTLV